MKTKFLLFNIIFLGLSFQNTFATNVPAGNVSGHWTLVNSPYLIMGNITVPQDSLLQIDAGVSVQFQGHYQFLIRGRIQCMGTSANQVMFNAVTDWWGIRFDGIVASQDSSVFIYCNIQKGNANGAGNYNLGGAFFISNFSKIRIEHCTITNNHANSYAGGIYLDHANPNIFSNTISYNTGDSYYGSGIYCNYSSPSIVNNTLTYNSGNIQCSNSSSPDIIGNTIMYNPGWGIGCESSSNPSIINNTISYNNMGIVLVGSSANIIGNVITFNSGNNYGTGIMTYAIGSPNIINNTIANNTAQQYGGGIYVSGTNSPVIKNTIIWGNSAPQGEQVSLQSTSVLSFFNCDVQGGTNAFNFWDMPYTFTGTYTNCIDLNPLFINTSTNNFSLQSTSPCINTGDTTGINLPLTDVVGNPRVCNNAVEMGAYEICSTGISEYSYNEIEVFFYPNPCKDVITFEISEKDLRENLRLQVINSIGDLTKEYPVSGTKTEFLLNALSSGVYFFQLMNEQNILCCGKIIKE